MLKLNKLVLNGVEYFPTEIMQFDGLSDSSFSFKRDSTYLGMDLEFDVEISFFCDSFKKELDEAYELNNVNNECLLYFDYLCGNLSPLPFVFKADWKTYRSNTNESTFKIKSTSDFAQFLEIDGNEVILDKNLLEDTYIRKIPLRYLLENEKYNASKVLDTQKVYANSSFASGLLPLNCRREFNLFLIGSTNLKINELEDGTEITQNDLIITTGGGYSGFDSQLVKGGQINNFGTISNGNIAYPEVEYQHIYENKLSDGNIKIDSVGINQIVIDFNPPLDVVAETDFISEIIIIGTKYDNPRIIRENMLTTGGLNNISNASLSQLIVGNTSILDINMNFDIKKNEKVWIYYKINLKSEENTGFAPGLPPRFFCNTDFLFRYNNYSFNINKNIKIQYLTETYAVNSNSDVNDKTHFITKSIHLKQAIPTLFPNCIDDFFGLSKNIDTYITNGEYLRSKIEPKDFILKPQEAFKDIEAIFPIALGLDYLNGTYKMRLMRHSDAYLDILYKVYDLVDEVEIKTSTLLVNDVEIGYEIFKDTQLSKNKKNTYNITNQIKNKYQKVSRWIADAYIIYKAIYLGKDIDGKEYDSNIFILSARKLNGKVTTLSNQTGYASDNITDDSGITSWINRRFASVFNLLRKNTQWFTSLKQKTELYNNSVYPLNIGTTFYDEFSGTFPNDKKILRSQLVAGGITQKFENTLITFSTPLSENEFIELTTKWYYLIGVNNGKEILYGNVISANLSEGVCEMQLIKRII